MMDGLLLKMIKLLDDLVAAIIFEKHPCGDVLQTYIYITNNG